MSYGKDNLSFTVDSTADVIKLTASSTNVLTVTSSGSNPVVSGISTLNVGTVAASSAITVGGVAVATQAFVSDTVQGRTWRPPVRAASTASLTLSDVVNGYVLDGVTLATGNRVLIKDQGDSTNGIYVVKASGTPDRAADFAATQTGAHAAVIVGEGTVNADRAYLMSNNAGNDTIGTHTPVFVQFGGGADVADGSITTAKLADANVTDAKLASNSVTTAKIAAGNVTAAKLATNSVATAAIQDDAVTTDKINAGAVGTTELADDAVTNAKIGSGAVGTTELADNAVTTAKITDLNVTTGKLADTAVTTAKITDANVTTAKIADLNVTTGKLADNAVTTLKITDANVTTAKIADLNVTTGKLADNAVTTLKITDANVTTAKIADLNVTTGKLADDAVTAAKLADNAVVAANISTGAVGTAAIADDAVTTAKILDANVTTAKILDANVTTAKLATGAVTATQLGANAVTGAKLNSNVAGINMVYNTVTSKLDSIRRVFDPVRCVATTNIVHTTALENGDTLDGLTLATGDRVLLAGQTNAALNGIWVVASSGTPTRADDMGAGRTDQLAVHSTVFVTSGTAGAGTTYRVSGTNGTATGILVNTETSTWTRVEAPVLASSITGGTFGAGTYSFSGRTISDLGTVTTANIDGGTIDGATIATSDITVGSGKTLNVSSGTLTTSATQKKNIIEGAASDLNIGSTYTMSASAFLATSDRNAKTNVRDMDLDHALESVLKMKGVKFDWKSNGGASTGVIAQDMQEIAPELVATNAKNELSFNYDGLNGYLIPAIQVLAKKCEELEEEVDKLKRKRSRAMMSDNLGEPDDLEDQPAKTQMRLD